MLQSWRRDILQKAQSVVFEQRASNSGEDAM